MPDKLRKHLSYGYKSFTGAVGSDYQVDNYFIKTDKPWNNGEITWEKWLS